MNLRQQLKRANHWGAEDQANDNDPDMVRESKQEMAEDAGCVNWSQMCYRAPKLARVLWKHYQQGRRDEKKCKETFLI